jgi:hypothetical protein
MTLRIAVAALACLPALLPAQTRRPFVRATGEGVVSFKPDQMKLSIGVTTQADTAQQAADDNATRSTVLIAAVQKLLGSSGDLRTISYSVTPVYKYPSGGGQPTLVGFTASNQIEITTSDMSIAGRLIDVSVSAGATTIGSIRFGLKDAEPARAVALKLATQKARSNAEAIASGLAAKIGAINYVAESTAAAITSLDRTAVGAAASTPTPVETGTVEIRATVVLEAELSQ